jgi:hypothetical protein
LQSPSGNASPKMRALRLLFLLASAAALPAPRALEQAPNTWVKRSPGPDTPPSPRLGYEGACVWDSKHHVLVRYGGHNQGGGGEQHAEVWTFDPLTARWTLKEPNTSPPGICCGQQNVYDPEQGRYLRFPAFSGSHGWQWSRELYLNDASVWSYELGANTWRNMRPYPAPSPRPLRCASWDSDHQVVVLFGGEGSQEGTWTYSPYTNTWKRMAPPRQPEFRSGGNMAYDAARKLHILFGAQLSDDPHTWAYDLAKDEWRDMRPPSMPPTDANDAVLTYDPVHRVVLALVKVTTGRDEAARHRLETWSYDAGANRWSKRNPSVEPDPSGSRARNLAFAPEYGLAVLENRTHPPQGPHEQQVWTYRYGEGRPETPSDFDLRVTTTARGAVLSWKPGAAPLPSRYEVLRGLEAPRGGAAYEKAGTVRVREGRPLSFRDGGVEEGRVHLYRVRGLTAEGKVLHESGPFRAQPRVPDGLVVSAAEARRVELTWRASPEPDVVAYRVERAPVEVLSEDQLPRLKARTPPLARPAAGAIRRVGQFVPVTAAPVRAPRFTDESVDLARPASVEGEAVYERRFGGDQYDAAGKPYPLAVYAYRVRAVNALGVESGPSAAVLTLPSAPQWVFAKEEGTACRLKWRANPERGVRGYRVYRMDGRFDREPVRRLTPDPVSDPGYLDPEAGRPTRRYYVVAVDALGQEGFPSSPVWHNREWRQFYTPFTGEWHQ